MVWQLVVSLLLKDVKNTDTDIRILSENYFGYDKKGVRDVHRVDELLRLLRTTTPSLHASTNAFLSFDVGIRLFYHISGCLNLSIYRGDNKCETVYQLMDELFQYKMRGLVHIMICKNNIHDMTSWFRFVGSRLAH